MTPRHGHRLGLVTTAAGLAIGAGLLAPSTALSIFPPEASFTASPNPAVVGETVTFDGSGSTDGADGTITTYEWDLDGDGFFEVDSDSSPTNARSYASSDTIPVSLRVTDSDGDSDSATIELEVHRAPTAGFIYEPSTAAVGEQVTFSSTSNDPEGPIADDAHIWDLDGDGEFDDAVGETVTHSFATAGDVIVSLQVTDSDGASATTSRTVTVGDQGPELGQDPVLMSPFPIVRLAGRLMPGGGTKIRRLSVRAPKRADVRVLCRGGSCPFGERSRKVKRHRVNFPGIERVLRPGVAIQVFVTEPETIGKFTRFKLRDGKVPKRKDRCVAAGSTKRIRCPQS
jgi:hypothetical protein